MIRHSIFALKDGPNPKTLRQYATRYGFRLFHEKHSNLYFLDSPADNDSKLPQFGGFYESVLVRDEKPGIETIETQIKALLKSKKLLKYQYNLELLKDALFFSDVFDTKIFCAYHDDEDTDMVVIAEKGTLIALKLAGAANEAGHCELQKTAETDFEIALCTEPDGYDAFYRQSFENTFDKPAPDLMFFGQDKPKGVSLKEQAKLFNITQSALLRRHGQFKLIDSEEVAISAVWQHISQKVGFSLKLVFLPFLVIGFFIWEAIENRKK